MIRPWHTSRASQRGQTGAAAAFVVLLALCQSPVRNLGRDQVQGPCCPTGSPTTPPSLPSCGWLRPTPSSSCASVRRAAATTGSPAVECRPTRPVRADPPPKTIRTTTATITPAAKDRSTRDASMTPGSARVAADSAAAPRCPHRRRQLAVGFRWPRGDGRTGESPPGFGRRAKGRPPVPGAGLRTARSRRSGPNPGEACRTGRLAAGGPARRRTPAARRCRRAPERRRPAGSGRRAAPATPAVYLSRGRQARYP